MELFNTISHGVVAIIFLWYTIKNKKKQKIFIFSVSCIICYSLSSIHHIIPNNLLLTHLDFAGIYVLIIGTYFSVFNNRLLISIASLISIMFFLAQLYNNVVYPIGYIIVGWLSIFGIFEILEKKSRNHLIFFGMGGIMFTSGELVNITKIQWSHEIFHVFVIGGTLCHLTFVRRISEEKRVDWTSPLYYGTSRVPIGRGQLGKSDGVYPMDWMIGGTIFRKDNNNEEVKGVRGDG